MVDIDVHFVSWRFVLVYVDYRNTILVIRTKDLKRTEAKSFVDVYKRIQVAVFFVCDQTFFLFSKEAGLSLRR